MEPSTFPIQKGSLNLLRKKWESSDYQRSDSCPGGSRCRLFQLKGSGLLEPEGNGLTALDPPEPPSLSCSIKEEVLSGEPEAQVPEDQSDKIRDYNQPEILKEDSLAGRRRIERFSIALDELRSIFETPKSGIIPAEPVEYVQKIGTVTDAQAPSIKKVLAISVFVICLPFTTYPYDLLPNYSNASIVPCFEQRKPESFVKSPVISTEMDLEARSHKLEFHFT
ncbi:hypothetical protein STEG23_001319 [Scotinomys teguina]